MRDYQDTKGNNKWAQLLVPKALQEKVVSSLHGEVASGHLGEEKTVSHIRERFYWPGFCMREIGVTTIIHAQPEKPLHHMGAVNYRA